jgi:hypothetical protein
MEVKAVADTCHLTDHSEHSKLILKQLWLIGGPWVDMNKLYMPSLSLIIFCVFVQWSLMLSAA